MRKMGIALNALPQGIIRISRKVEPRGSKSYPSKSAKLSIELYLICRKMETDEWSDAAPVNSGIPCI